MKGTAGHLGAVAYRKSHLGAVAYRKSHLGAVAYRAEADGASRVDFCRPGR